MPSAKIVAALLFITLGGCAVGADGLSDDERCILRVWYRPERALLRTDIKLTRDEAFSPALIGSWNNFLRPGLSMFDVRTSSGGEILYTVGLPLQKGSYMYGLLVGNYLLLDDVQPQSAFAKD